MTDLFAANPGFAPLPDFACWLDLSGQPDLRPTMFFSRDMVAEVDREAAQRRSVWARYVDAGRMTPEDRDRGIAVMLAIAADLQAYAQPSPDRRVFADDGFTWADKVKALQAEISTRRRLYPKWIESGRIDRPIAAEQLACLEAVHWLYWYHGMRWTPTNGADPQWGTVHVDAAAERARNEFRAHTARFTRNIEEKAAIRI